MPGSAVLRRVRVDYWDSVHHATPLLSLPKDLLQSQVSITLIPWTDEITKECSLESRT